VTAPVVHPSWCEVERCGVIVVRGEVTGAHRSRVVVIEAQTADQVEVKVNLWQIHGREVHVSMDWNRPHGVPVDGILFDLTDAAVLARAVLDLVRLAGAS
jgi:hypothetical protein